MSSGEVYTVIRSQKTYRPEPAVEVHVLAPAKYIVFVMHACTACAFNIRLPQVHEGQLANLEP